MDSSNSKDEILHDFIPFLKVYKDGRIERYLLTESVGAGVDPISGSQSKDVLISSSLPLSVRIFLPKQQQLDSMAPKKKLPLLLHFHGGGFCVGSAFGPITKFSLSHFVNLAGVVAVSVDYRLAPEHPLPVAYDDCWAALQWVAAHSKGDGPEPWLNQHADFSRVYLMGESAGGNLAHDVAIRASVADAGALNPGLRIVGLNLIHPYFGEREPDKLMQYLYPGSSGSNDEPRLNPGVDPRLSKLVCKKVLVCVAEKDMLRDRGVAYFNSLTKSGWNGTAEIIETQGETHCFHLLNPSSPNTPPFLHKLASFLNDEDEVC